MLSLDVQKIAKGNIIALVPLNSPISGYVGHINASIGTFAEPNRPIFDIVDNSKVHVDLMVYEKDIYKVKPNQKVDFVLTNQGNEIIQGKIFGISKSFENETKALTVHASILGKSPELIPGMFVNALIETGSGSVPALPVQAVVNEAGKEYIFIKTANENSSEENIVFKRIEIKSGLEDLGYVEILPLDKLPPDAEIAVKGTFYIHSVFKPGVDEE
jgi:cobalt-zinc-cadmium efflux system membrane fusion protein